MRAAKELARRYRLTFVELLPADQESPIDYELFNEIPVDLMVRHQFLPLKRDEKGLHIAMADPTRSRTAWTNWPAPCARASFLTSLPPARLK